MDLQTSGFAAGIYQRDPQLIETALRVIEAEPQLVLNGVGYFRSDQMVEAVRAIERNEAEKNHDGRGHDEPLI